MQHVFVSYKHEDLDFAENIISRLEKEGFATWTDLKIGVGEEWRTAIDIAIKNAVALIVVMTPEAKSSEYITYEWAFAWGVGIRVIPIMLRPTQLHPRLEALQYLDFTNAKSRPWDKLMEEVRAACDAPLAHSVSIPLNSPPFLRQAVASLDSSIRGERAAAIETLLTARTPAASAVLKESLTHPVPDVRRAAAVALGQLGDGSMVPALIEALRDGDTYECQAAAEVLGQLGDASAVPALIDVLRDGDNHEYRVAATALGRLGDASAVPALIEALRDRDAYEGRLAAWALGQLGDASAVPALIEALRDRDYTLRTAAAAVLGQLGDASAVPALIDTLKDPMAMAETQEAAAAALGQLGDVSAVPVLTHALRERDSGLQRAVARALDQLRDALRSLLEILKH